VELESKLMATLYKGLIFGMMNNIIMAPAITRKTTINETNKLNPEFLVCS